MMTLILKKGALSDACIALAKSVQGTRELSADIVETLAARYETEAAFHLDAIIAQGRDPNILTRAICYLTDAHGIPPMGTDIVWFRNMLTCVIELAVPNTAYGGESIAFIKDIKEGLDASIDLDNALQ